MIFDLDAAHSKPAPAHLSRTRSLQFPWQLTILIPIALALAAIYVNARSPTYGFDFRGGMWQAGHAILHGRSPYPRPDVNALVHDRSAFLVPPVLGLIAVPFSLLPWVPALILWNLTCLAAFVAALSLVGVRDLRVYAVAVCSFPFVSSLGFGQTEGLLALGLAAGWRWRDSTAGPVAVGLIIAAKLFVWPLAVWLVLTRGVRGGALAIGSAMAALAGSWALIGFDGLVAYPRLLLADIHSASDRTHSIMSALVRLGAAAPLAQLAGLAVASAVAFRVARSRPSRDRALFVSAVAFSLLSSSLLEMHYLTLLLICLAISRPRLDRIWLFAATVFWLSPQEPPRSVWQIVVVVSSAIFLLTRASYAKPGSAPASAASLLSDPLGAQLVPAAPVR